MSAVTQSTSLDRWVLPRGRSYEAVNELISAPLLQRKSFSWRVWWIAFGVSLALTVLMLISAGWLLIEGVGVWGNNTTVVWGLRHRQLRLVDRHR